MKKFVSLILAFVLILSMGSVSHAQEPEEIEVTPLFLTVTDYTATEWVSSGVNRMFLATNALIDLLLTYREDVVALTSEAMANNAVYVADDFMSLNLYIFFFGDETVILLHFDPTAETTRAVLIQYPCQYTQEFMDGLVEDGALNSYYKVENTDIYTTYENILTIIG